MKRIMVFVIGLAFVLSTVVFAAETAPVAPKKEKAPAAAAEKAPAAAAEKAPAAAAEKAPA
ncbi:MAG: hypothetical protein Q8O44_02970, partial [Syntrophales bacterium]|nr:hypothetical protein [Syntrophales bacterium]